MSVKKISEAILGVGVDDTTIDLFESQYPVPTGVSYNSYVILDEKTAILDTVDNRATEPWLANLTEALAGRKPDYLVVSHMEPDHGANIARLAALYPEMQVVGNAKTFLYMDQFFGADVVAKERRVVVKDGESLSLGTHTLTFVLAPMVHWPEVMVSYESSEKVLFSADGFGRFGAVARFDENADWASEARRYYLNIVGKYGPQVQALLKKAAALDIATICPLHGPVLTGDLSKYLNYYDLWSSYKAEEPEKILVASASIHGHTRAAAHTMAEKLRNMTAVYLFREGKLLMLYRVGSRVVAPSWCGVGGHFEQAELNDPRACALRELREETGLTEESLEELRLRYITLRMKNGEIRQNYYFFAGLKPGAAVRGTCDEGRLEWVPYDSVLKREMPFTAKTVLRHYLRVGCRTRCIYGSVTEAEDSAFTELAEF